MAPKPRSVPEGTILFFALGMGRPGPTASPSVTPNNLPFKDVYVYNLKKSSEGTLKREVL